MVQRFLAILLIIAGLGGIGYGIATATVLRESDTVVATATPSGDGTLVVTEPGVLGLVDDQVTVRATVPEGQKVTLALGSEVDVLGWVGDDPYDSVTGLSTWETLSVAPGTPPEAEQTGEESGEQPGEESADAGKPAKGPDPSGSDMWLSEVSGETTVSMRWTEEPGRVVLLAAGVGDGAEAPTLELTWPRPASTPYLWPGVLGGGFALILGVFMAIGARRGKKKATTRTSSTVRTRRTESELPRRDVFGVDGDQTEAQADGPGFPPAQPGPPAGPGSRPAGGAFPPAGEPAESGTAVFLPAARLRPGRGRRSRSPRSPSRPRHGVRRRPSGAPAGLHRSRHLPRRSPPRNLRPPPRRPSVVCGAAAGPSRARSRHRPGRRRTAAPRSRPPRHPPLSRRPPPRRPRRRRAGR
nr:hypothetical protein GCM10025730_42150 [Promicromonospora thailandica]